MGDPRDTDMYPYFHSLEDTQRRTVRLRATLVLTIKTQVVDFRRVSKAMAIFTPPARARDAQAALG